MDYLRWIPSLNLPTASAKLAARLKDVAARKKVWNVPSFVSVPIAKIIMINEDHDDDLYQDDIDIDDIDME